MLYTTREVLKMGFLQKIPINWTFEVMQTVGGRYYVRFKPSSWQCGQGDVVALVLTKTVWGKRPRIEFTIRDQTAYTSDNLPPGENPRVLKIVQQYLERRYPGFAVAS